MHIYSILFTKICMYSTVIHIPYSLNIIIDLCSESYLYEGVIVQSSWSEQYYVNGSDILYKQYQDNNGGCYGGASFISTIYLNGSIFENDSIVFGFDEYYTSDDCSGYQNFESLGNAIQWNTNKCITVNSNYSRFCECVNNQPLWRTYNNNNCYGNPYQNVTLNKCQLYDGDYTNFFSVNNPM